MCSADKVYRIKIDQICGAHVYIKIEKLDYAKTRWDLARLKSNAKYYTSLFSIMTYKSKHIRFNMYNDEDVRRMVAEISVVNRYYGINLANIARDWAYTVKFRNFNCLLN